ncbi:transporter [Pseudarthrobacter sp. J64]|uniref:transporter n=1 Tax=Pseudarthrobacter sp. J64 TaxID=3116485 RepID=UPI002E821674|nr:transporter [Pseudarthrobacter sp. J64]MEE2568412.1 transporter [Pseudarthrobacter sp. J64]
MVAHLLKLKLTLLRNGLRRSPWQLVGLIIGGLYALGMVTMLIIGLFLLPQAGIPVAHTVIVLGGAAAVLGWALLPVVLSAADLTLDPSRFTTYAIPMPRMLAGLALGGLIGIPGTTTALVSLGTVATWSQGILPALGALAGAVLGTMTCIVIARVTTSATAGLASSRKFKDASGVIAFIPLMLLGPIMAGIAQGISNSAGFLTVLAQGVSWTPFGAAWSLGGDLAAGNGGAAMLKLVLACAYLALLVWAWKILLARALVNPAYSGGSTKRGRKLGFFALTPSTPAGAVTARALTYWFRDPRYGGSLVVIPLLAVVLFFQSAQNGDAGSLVVMGPLTAFLMAWSISADVSYDNTAFALHLSTGVSGRADRLGRALACLVLSVPLVLFFTVLPFAISGDWTWLPGVLGLSIGVLLTGLGLSSVVSARYNVAVPLPGDSPFKKPPGNTAQTMLVQFGGMLLLVLLAAPEIGLIITQSVTGNAVFGWINLVVGPILGLALFAAGVRIGGRWLDARGPEMLAQLSVNR